MLLNKFISNNIPEHIIVWSLDFLNGRKQFVKIGNSVSNTTVVGAGTPQGTVSGPNDFKLVINDSHSTRVMRNMLMIPLFFLFRRMCVTLHSKLLQIISSVGLTIME